MLKVATQMLVGDRAKFAALLFGIAFTAFLVTFAMAYFCGFMTRGFALVAENATADVWVMDPAVAAVEQVTNMPSSVLSRVRSVDGVRYAVPLAVGSLDVRFPNGRFQNFEVIGVDDATLAGVPQLDGGGAPTVLRMPDAVIVDSGGTTGKLLTPTNRQDQWPYDGAHLEAATRELTYGDELMTSDHRLLVVGHTQTLPRFPPRPLLYTTYSTAAELLPRQRSPLTYVLATAAADVPAEELASRIEARIGVRARTADRFTEDTVRWTLANSEDVGDMAAMLTLAMTVGLGVTGVMLYMFTYENLKQYAVLKALGANSGLLLGMIFAQTAMCALLGAGLGLGLCSVVGEAVSRTGYPFRMMWFTPLLGFVGVLLVSVAAAAVSARPVLKLEPEEVFVGR